MDKLQKYKPTDKMIDLIGDNYSLLPKFRSILV